MFKNKTILITGASRGLGASMAESFANQGASVVLLARDLNKLESVRKKLKNSSKHLSISIDLTDLTLIDSTLKSLQKKIDGVDVIVHAAGGGLGFKNDFLDHSQLTKLFNLNLACAIEINRILIPEMIEKKVGSILHIGSIASFESAGSVGYNTVKAAISGYVRSIGRQLLKDNVILTGALLGGFISEGNAMFRLKTKNPIAYKEFIENRLPRKKMGTVEELIPALMLLCSHDSGMLGGCVFPMDAGEGKAYFT